MLRFCCSFFLISLIVGLNSNLVGCETTFSISLSRWKLSSSADPHTVYEVEIPSTVLGALVEANVYPEPFYSLNLPSIPLDPFEVPWVYESTFQLPSSMDPQSVWINIEGLSYQGDLFINDQLVPGPDASSNSSSPPPFSARQLIGTVRIFQLDITSFLSTSNGLTQKVRLEIDRPQDSWHSTSTNTDLAISFIDWAPNPQDSSMGLWKAVSFIGAPFLSQPTTTGPFMLQFPGIHVRSLSTREAVVDLVVDAWNLQSETLSPLSPALISAIFTVSIDEIPGFLYNASVRLPAHESHALLKASFSIPDPELWWPWHMLPQGVANPFLYTMRLSLSLPSPPLAFRFGVRTASSQLNERGFRQYYINGQPFVPLGAGGCPDLFLRATDERVTTELQMVRFMGLNTVRLEGKFPSPFFYQETDRLGIMVMPGFECCDAWQRWSLWTPQVLHVAKESLRAQVQQLRANPSVFVFLIGSDQEPPPAIEADFQTVFDEEAWPNPILVSAAAVNSTLSGSSGVKMSGPYAWEPPIYWSDPENEINNLGGPFGFLTEGGPGAAPMLFSSWATTVPSAALWPADNEVVGDPYWDGHCGNPQGKFGTLQYFDPPLNARYGSSSSAQEYLFKSQVAAYESHRVMFEEYSRAQVSSSTGLIHWMLNSAYPSHIWHLYDWYLAAGGSYYGAKKALTDPVHAMYRYSDGTVWLYSNLAAQPSVSVSLLVQVINLDASVVHSQKATLAFSPIATLALTLTLPPLANLSDTYLVRLQWSFANQPFDDLYYSDYWLSAVSRDILEWSQSSFFQTPCSQFSDMTALQSLFSQPVVLSIDFNRTVVSNSLLQVVVKNASPQTLAFAVEMTLIDALSNQPILPQSWSDNYFNLLPNQSRTLTVQTLNRPFPSNFQLVANCWNNIIKK